MKALILSLAMLFALAGCAGSMGGANYDSFSDDTHTEITS